MKIDDLKLDHIEIDGRTDGHGLLDVKVTRQHSEQTGWIDKAEAIKIIEHLQKVFELGVYEPVARKFTQVGSKRHYSDELD